MTRPKISLVLPTFNREELLCQTLADLLRLDYPDYEIIVVDQTPLHHPNTQAYLDEIKNQIRYLRQEKPSVTLAANQGAQVAKGEIALFVDDDIRIPDRNFIWLHAQNYEDRTIGGVAGRALDASDPRKVQFDPPSSNPNWDHKTSYDITAAVGANMSFRRQLILSLGGFDENFLTSAFRFEDDFCLRVWAAGYRVVYDPKPTVHHFLGSTGGNENRYLLGRDAASHNWYHFFFHNQIYFAFKHLPRQQFPLFLWDLYRAHVMNRIFVSEGPQFLLARHRAFASGLAQGWTSYRKRRSRAPLSH